MKSNYDLIQNEQICKIQRKNGNFYLNEISIEPEQVNKIKQQLEDTIQLIENKIEDDENQLKDILYEMRVKIERQRNCQILNEVIEDEENEENEEYEEEQEINIKLKSIKRKYEKILNSLQNEQDFQYLFIHPDYILINNQTSIYIQSHIDIYQDYCGYNDEYCQHFLEDLLATKQGIKLTWKMLSVYQSFNPRCHDYFDYDHQLCHKNDNQQESDFKQIYLQGNLVPCDLSFMAFEQNLKIGPSIKKLSFDHLGIYCLNIQFQCQSINILQFVTKDFLDLKYLLKQIDESQSLEIGLIVVDKWINNIKFEDAKQLLECRYLICIMNTHGERNFIEDDEYYIKQIEKEKQLQDIYDIYLFQQEQKQQQKKYDNKNYYLQNKDDMRLFNKPFKRIQLGYGTSMNMNQQKAFFNIINKRFSHQFSTIATCKIFEGQFSLYRILYDLNET